MRLYLFLFILIFHAHFGYTWNAVQEHQGVRFAKWLLNGNPVWTDNERNQMILANVVFSSKILTVLDFVPNLPSQDEIALSSTVFNATWDGNVLWADNLSVNDVKSLLTDKKYIRLKAEEIQKKIDLELELTADFNDTKASQKFQQNQSAKEFARRKYQSLP